MVWRMIGHQKTLLGKEYTEPGVVEDQSRKMDGWKADLAIKPAPKDEDYRSIAQIARNQESKE